MFFIEPVRVMTERTQSKRAEETCSTKTTVKDCQEKLDSRSKERNRSQRTTGNRKTSGNIIYQPMKF